MKIRLVIGENQKRFLGSTKTGLFGNIKRSANYETDLNYGTGFTVTEKTSLFI